jgi:hypothetical protein
MKNVIEYKDNKDLVSEIDIIKNKSETFYFAKEMSEVEADVKIQSEESSFSECHEVELLKDKSEIKDQFKSSLEEVYRYNLDYIERKL